MMMAMIQLQSHLIKKTAHNNRFETFIHSTHLCNLFNSIESIHLILTGTDILIFSHLLVRISSRQNLAHKFYLLICSYIGSIFHV